MNIVSTLTTADSIADSEQMNVSTYDMETLNTHKIGLANRQSSSAFIHSFIHYSLKLYKIADKTLLSNVNRKNDGFLDGQQSLEVE